eukprot:m.117936 g.117936  ORF g.117936 m.117936 type:complete len:114 (-) comp9333_c0_seq11:34-375(-)
MDKVAADTGVEDVVDKSCDDNVVIDNGNGEQEEENEAQAEELVESVVGNVADESKVEHVLEASKVMAKDLADLVAPQSESVSCNWFVLLEVLAICCLYWGKVQITLHSSFPHS